jgi:S-adenosyl methyltransferase
VELITERDHGSVTSQGRTAYIAADMRDPQAIISAPEFQRTLDLKQPIGLLLIAIVHFIKDDAEALRVVRQVLDVLPAGSYLAMSIATDLFDPLPLAKVKDIAMFGAVGRKS